MLRDPTALHYPTRNENIPLDNTHVLVAIVDDLHGRTNLLVEKLRENFFGIVISTRDQLDELANNPYGESGESQHCNLAKREIYLTGYVTRYFDHPVIKACNTVHIIEEFVLFDDDLDAGLTIDSLSMSPKIVLGPNQVVDMVRHGQVPIHAPGRIGVMIPRFFKSDGNYFEKISKKHKFQNLTESTKEGSAYRTGIYITPVEVDEDGNRYFRLLRCSSNFKGPTSDVTDTDREILASVNEAARRYFANDVSLNHVLAQIYHNSKKEDGTQIRAAISEHSDKTKDMTLMWALMAFATFYQNFDGKGFPHLHNKMVRPSKTDGGFDQVYGNRQTSVLTKLVFRLKPDAKQSALEEGIHLDEVVELTMYPNSLFIMSLQFNRMYTHEIVPSNLNTDLLPVRMGYVIRCSGREAVYDPKTNKTMVYYDGIPRELTAMTNKEFAEELAKVREFYARQNQTSEEIKYPLVTGTMNHGDLSPPEIPDEEADEEADDEPSGDHAASDDA